MLRHEDRLYHIVISFPSICARQFFIFKFRRNEAIFCLIGFGIGIGCCLVYRWFQAKLLTFNQISMNYQNKEIDINKNNIKDLYSESNRKKKFRIQNLRILRKKQPKAKQSKFCEAFGIENMIRYLSKLQSKNSRQKIMKKNNVSHKMNHSVPIDSGFQLKKTSNSNSTSTFDLTKTLKNTDKNNNQTDINFFRNKKKTSSFSNQKQLYSDNSKIKDKKESYSSSSINKNDLYFSDDDSFEVPTSFGNHCFNFKDNLSSTKHILSKNEYQYSVDKSLDEALQHIDRLKKDMNHLCTDLDSLYNSQKNSCLETNDSFELNDSKNSSNSSLNFEFDDDLLEDFSSFNENCRFKKPLRDTYVPQCLNFSLNEKSTQTSKIRPRILTIKTIKRITNRKMNLINRKALSL